MAIRQSQWRQWGTYKARARQGITQTLGFLPDSAHMEDLIEEVALRLMEHGGRAQWRVVDVLREWYGRYAREHDGVTLRLGSQRQFSEEIHWRSSVRALHQISPEHACQLIERFMGGTLNPPEKGRPHKITTTRQDFARRWI